MGFSMKLPRQRPINLFPSTDAKNIKQKNYSAKHLANLTATEQKSIAIYYINTNEIPGELSRENMISSHVKITCYLHM